MKATWFDHLRGVAQGRIADGAAPDGARTFVLGGAGIPEAAMLSPGDFTEVKQLVDLTGWDLIGATMDTVGKVAAQYQPGIGWPADPADLWHFDFNLYGTGGRNLVDGAFDLVGQGDIEPGVEAYSPQQTVCRVIPVGSTTASMQGVNTPAYAPGVLARYTYQVWLNFNCDAHPTSWGVSPMLFECLDAPNDGVRIYLSGAAGPGAHAWSFYVFHMRGGASAGRAFPGYVFDTPSPGWHLYSIVYNIGAAPGTQLLLYVDDDPVPVPASSDPGLSPGAAAAGTPIQFASPNLWGGIDESRMVSRAMTPSEIALSYQQSTVLSPPVGMAWAMQLLVDDQVFAERIVRPGEARRWTDFKAPVRRLIGEHQVAFRLELQEA